jgi:hypothetical protein
MDLRDGGLDVVALRIGHRRERIGDALVAAGCDQAALHAELFHRAGQVEAVQHDADRTDHRRLVGVDLVGGDSDVIAPRRTGLLDDRVDALLVQRLQAADLVVDQARLHRAPAGRIEAQHDRPRVRLLEGAAQARQQVSALASEFGEISPRTSISAVCGPVGVTTWVRVAMITATTSTPSSSQTRRKNSRQRRSRRRSFR